MMQEPNAVQDWMISPAKARKPRSEAWPIGLTPLAQAHSLKSEGAIGSSKRYLSAASTNEFWPMPD